MKLKPVLAVAAVMALAFAAVAVAAPAPYKVTGGGQTFATSNVGSDGKPTVNGPGDTISFQAFIQAQGERSDSTGQVNIIDRGPSGSAHFKGVVTCTFLASSDSGGGYAELRGHGTKDNVDRNFIVRVMDNGQGADSTDGVQFNTNMPDANCGKNFQGNAFEMLLGRGNATIHKVNNGASKSSTSAPSTSLTNLGLAGL